MNKERKEIFIKKTRKETFKKRRKKLKKKKNSSKDWGSGKGCKEG